jgi:hypothetical protein
MLIDYGVGVGVVTVLALADQAEKVINFRCMCIRFGAEAAVRISWN